MELPNKEDEYRKPFGNKGLRLDLIVPKSALCRTFHLEFSFRSPAIAFFLWLTQWLVQQFHFPTPLIFDLQEVLSGWRQFCPLPFKFTTPLESNWDRMKVRFTKFSPFFFYHPGIERSEGLDNRRGNKIMISPWYQEMSTAIRVEWVVGGENTGETCQWCHAIIPHGDGQNFWSEDQTGGRRQAITGNDLYVIQFSTSLSPEDTESSNIIRGGPGAGYQPWE